MPLLGTAASPAQMYRLVWTGGGHCGRVLPVRPCTWVGVNTEHHQPLLLEQQTRVSWDWELEEKEHFP